ncbi:RNA polymerase sigma-70 factor [Oceanobacillus neutriphilus]|uniref:RNA polymerase sigma factor SigJ n=1 Tax=Oceanobacillus neutriphilus TaxID=531815 RepID=A0ABQ2NWY5_9BACI|nr:RNA polymerase sigma-70 factor [Oceanobacillus neutriphilus]GGP12614.1 RNA polymerase sigma factor SigJ [Oceanobacillus neutriphilus]
METEQLYRTYKSLLFSLAYRMLGNVMDAEDIVHEAFLLLEKIDHPEEIRNTKAYLCKIVTNRSIDKLRSAAKKREVYVGTWLPDPLVEEYSADPSSFYMTKESVSTAYLLLLQQLTEVERAVFLLREMFQYDYDDIASIVGKSNANCRQIFHRAKKGIMHNPDSMKQDFGQLSGYVEEFAQAVQDGNMSEILALLKKDAVYYSDGGGKIIAATRPVYGAEYIARFFLGVINKLPEGFSIKFAKVNGGPGIVIIVSGNVKYVLSVEVKDEKIRSIYMVANPDKLSHLKAF